MKSISYWLISLLLLAACQNAEQATGDSETARQDPAALATEMPHEIAEGDSFDVRIDRFADLQVYRYRVPGWEQLSLDEKKLLYYLSQAAYAGRDIMWDQNFRYNLAVRKVLEQIWEDFPGERSGEQWEKFAEYSKRVWFSNGIHHHYSYDKIQPEFSLDYFRRLVRQSGIDNKAQVLETLVPVIFDPNFAAYKINTNEGVDQVKGSAINFYDPDLTQAEIEAFYNAQIDKNDPEPISYGLNTKVVRGADGKPMEVVWKVGGMYTEALEQVVYWLEKAVEVAENDAQRDALQKLAAFYRSGDLADFDAYNIAWVRDVDSKIDVINGFIEVYNDPLGYKGSFESVVSIRDPEATKRIAAIGSEAQWFEDNSPLIPEHKKRNVRGISAKVINVVAESGDASPSTPIGINLPNANWIRATHGSKSVNLANIVDAYESGRNQGPGALSEFAYSEEEIARARQYGSLADDLHTDMHEVIGHASGRLEPGIGTPKETMGSYASTIEEGRADLVALYYMLDNKLVEMGLMPSLEVGKTAYDDFIRNGLMVQLRRIEPGKQITEAHMQNRAWISRWVLEKGAAENVIERKTRDGKTFFVINDYEKLRELFGQLLREVQRIKSQGDQSAAAALVENYGKKVDPELHQEVLDRFANLNIAPYSGFVNPVLVAVEEGDEIVDVKLEYPENFVQQMLYYGNAYARLPVGEDLLYRPNAAPLAN